MFTVVIMSWRKNPKNQAHQLIILHIIHQLIIRTIQTIHHIHNPTNGVEIITMIIINGVVATIIHRATEIINMEVMEILINLFAKTQTSSIYFGFSFHLIQTTTQFLTNFNMTLSL